MASRKQEIRKEIKKKNAKLGIDVEAAKNIVDLQDQQGEGIHVEDFKMKNIMEKLFHFLQHHKKQKKALFQKLKVFSMMKENNLKN